jgi:hypothetical protein
VGLAEAMSLSITIERFDHDGNANLREGAYQFIADTDHGSSAFPVERTLESQFEVAEAVQEILEQIFGEEV